MALGMKICDRCEEEFEPRSIFDDLCDDCCELEVCGDCGELADNCMCDLDEDEDEED